MPGNAQAPPVAGESDQLVAAVRRFAAGELAPQAEALDLGLDGARQEAWNACVELNLDQALLSEGRGGTGLDTKTFCALLEELAVGDGGVAAAVLLHNAALTSIASGPGALPSGRWTVVPPNREALRCRSENGRALLEGRLPFVLGAAEAAGVVVFARDGEGPERALALELKGDGIAVQPQRSQMGLRAAGAAEIALDSSSAETSGAMVGGDVADLVSGIQVLLWRGIAAIAAGIARSAEEKARNYAQERRQGGVAIAEHDAVRLMLADMSARRLARGGDGRGGWAEALAQKIAVTDAALATTIDAVQVFGGAGYMVEAGVEKAMRDAKYCQLFPESNLVARLALFETVQRGMAIPY